MSAQHASRKALSDLISNIISLPRWKSDRERLLVYANIYVRLAATEQQDDEQGTQILTRATALAAKALSLEAGTSFYEACYRCNKAIHRLTDDDGDYIWADNGTLCPKWQGDLKSTAEALAKAAPAAFMPTTEPDLLADTNMLSNTTPLVKNRSNQHRGTMPQAVKALDVLFKQKYRLNATIMNLTNLPIDINISKNYAAKQIMLKAAPAFKDTFCFAYTLDARGRVYARSLIVTPQGSSFDKAVIEFAEPKELGQYGLQALMIHYANCSGHDKLSFKNRIKWARTAGYAKAEAMFNAVDDWLEIQPLIEDTKHQFEEYAAAIDFWLALNTVTNPKNYKSALVTHQDATNSGFQFGAALTGDRATAEDVNLTCTKTSTELPADLYGKMAVNLNKQLNENTPNLLHELPNIDRKFCKTPIMVTGYGAGIKAVMTDTQRDYPKVTDELSEQLKPHMKKALHKTASSMLDLTDLLRNDGETLMAREEEKILWTTPDGFRCIQTYRDNSAREVKLTDKLISHTKLAKGEQDPIDTDKMSTALPPNFIHSIDAQMLRTAALNADAKNIAFCPIHDSFGTHAATFFDLNWELKEAFVETMKYDWYANFCTMNMLPQKNIKTGDYDASECLKATYMFS